MALSPQDIHNKEFSVKMRGYNIDQVNDFLDRIVKDYQITLQENVELKNSLNDAQSKVKYFNNLKDSLNQSILVAQEAADRVKRNSKRNAELATKKSKQNTTMIIRRAKKQSNQIIQHAIHKANQLTVETTDLRRSTNMFRHKIQALLRSQLEMTKSKRWDKLLGKGAEHNDHHRLTDRFDNLSNGDSSNNDDSRDKSNVIIYPDGTYREI